METETLLFSHVITKRGLEDPVFLREGKFVIGNRLHFHLYNRLIFRRICHPS